MSPISGRRRPIVRALTRPGYAALDLIGAIAAGDAERLVELGAEASRITITGDPRVDSAVAKLAALPDDWALRRLTQDAPTLVAGSTWAGDERILIDAWHVIRSKRTDARLILVPHEPTAPHLAALAARLARAGAPGCLLSSIAAGAPVPSLVIVDRVGVLAGLYRGAAVAYVGGGFGRAGLHSVLEPAVCGIPTIVGPRWQASREAGLLIDAEAAVALSADPVAASAQLIGTWSRWLEHPESRETAGRAALAVVERERGGARGNASLVEALMGE